MHSLRAAMEPCDYCENERRLTGDLPLCANCATRLSADPGFGDKLSAYYVDKTRRSVERMRDRVAGMRLLTPQGTKRTA